ncbi:nitroreductase family deazaflavin-dependent oxidoreductase [Actinopolymorpha rutila]|uniref:Deazaflavin-dependent oxidoreductase (Nitroreductase family) n=1 Tax=Actinopolymorpha rutila TaxID=446787 RepID=A0A852ZKV6_9ACTN|nr:nitroreductase family deazaflavin-dependent oxidoreductase [Actinopolymorpha rutila]NYH93687.1 deazaflavin-dependent oxidoreductase (nitroreductase family) [Actinopolymorpha rutila]
MTDRATPAEHAELAAQLTVDLTTRGRRSGRPLRVEIWWFHVDGRFVITGTPGPRHWYANVLADPHVTVHVDGLDLAAIARPVTDPEARRRVFTDPRTGWYREQADLEELVRTSPMIELEFTAPAVTRHRPQAQTHAQDE